MEDSRINKAIADGVVPIYKRFFVHALQSMPKEKQISYPRADEATATIHKVNYAA